jgi:rubrerythrin
MDQKTLIARIRQLLVADKNAFDVYMRKIFSDIADDEKRHTILSAEMLSLLEK